MEIIESLFCKYYNYNEIMLLFSSIVLGIGATVGAFFLKDNIRSVININIQKIFYILMSACVGALLHMIGIVFEVEYMHFNIMIFVLAIVLIILYGISQCIAYRKVAIPLLQAFKNIEYVIVVEVFLLALLSKLELLEWLTGALAIICIEIAFMLYEKVKHDEEKVVSKESDYPNDDLYYTRLKQLENFLPVLEQQKEEPYAIMISGEWGIGKTSFVKALENKLEKDVFIWVRAGCEKTVSETMKEISNEILGILNDNNILVDKGSLIEKYFFAFSGLFEDTGFDFFGKITNIFVDKEKEDSKKYLNNKLKELDKTIYIVIDDLDRCSKDHQANMFNVIVESMELEHCKTIFLVDKKQFLQGDFKEHYIEKYISYTLDLCKVDYTQILNYHIDDIFGEENFLSISNVLLKDRSLCEIKKEIVNFINDILEKLEKELAESEKYVSELRRNNSFQDEVDQEQDRRDIEMVTRKINDIEDTTYEITKNTTNSRKVKNFLKGIKRDIYNINLGIEELDKEFQSQDWIDVVVRVQFIKNFLPKVYADIVMCGDIATFAKKYCGYTVGTILGLKYKFLFYEERMYIIYNHIIYKIDNIDYNKIKSERKKFIDELYSPYANIKHINDYLLHTNTYEDYNKILEICNSQNFETVEARETFVKNILNVLDKQRSFQKVDNLMFYELSKNLLDIFKRFKLNLREKNYCISKGRMIIRQVIVSNTHLLRCILLILFENSKVEKSWEALAVTDVNEFYNMLKKIDSGLIYEGLEDDVNKLLGIRTYYKNLEIELKKEKYKEVKLDIDNIFYEINIIFDTCMLWDNVESILEDSDEEDELSSFKQYFLLDNMYTIDNAVFYHISNLKLALEILKRFYELKKDCYKSEYSLFIMRIAHEVLRISETNQEWFEGKETEIKELLVDISEMCYSIDKQDTLDAEQWIMNTKVYIYKFVCYCESIEVD